MTVKVTRDKKSGRLPRRMEVKDLWPEPVIWFFSRDRWYVDCGALARKTKADIAYMRAQRRRRASAASMKLEGKRLLARLSEG